MLATAADGPAVVMAAGIASIGREAGQSSGLGGSGGAEFRQFSAQAGGGQVYRPCLFQRQMPTLFRRQQDRVARFDTLLPEGNWAHGCLEASLNEGLTGSQAEQMFSD